MLPVALRKEAQGLVVLLGVMLTLVSGLRG